MKGVAALGLAFLAPWAQAALPEVSTGSITLRQVLALAERENPEILAARKRWEAARRRIAQEATPEKPRVDLERMYSRGGLLGSPEEKSFSVTQEIPFPTTLYLRGSRASKEAGMAEQAYRAKVREVLARTRSAYAMLYLSYKSLDLYNENIELVRRFARVAESKYAVGHASLLDALKAQVELTKMLNMGVVIVQDKELAQAMLNALLGRPQAPLGLPRDPDKPRLDARLEDLEGLALSGRPELREAFLATERASRSLALARSEFLPDLMVQVRRRTDPMRGVTHDGILGFTLPLWFWKPAARLEEARAESETSEAELKAETLMTLSELKSRWVRTKTAQRLAEIYRTSVLPQAEEALKVAEAGYQAEKTSFLDLLDAQRTLLDFRLEYYQYVAEYEQRLAELERVVGRELQAP